MHSFIFLFFILEIPDPILGFGRSVSWKEDGAVIPPGHTMTYKDALHVATNDFILKVALPSWALGLTPRLQKVKLGFEDLRVCITNNMLTLLTFFFSYDWCVDIFGRDDTRASNGG